MKEEKMLLHSPSQPRRSRRRLVALGVATLVVASGLTVLSATSASALEIDCGYGGRALEDYIGAGRDGVFCLGKSNADPDSRPREEIDPWDSHGAGGASTSTGCRFLPPSSSGITYDRVESVPFTQGIPGYTFGSHTSYWRGSGDDAKIVATRDIIGEGHLFRVRISDYTFYTPFGGGYISQSTFDCHSEGWNVNVVSMAPGAPLTLPEGTTTPTSEKVTTTSSLRPIPGRIGEYFLRVDIRNLRSQSTPVIIDLQKDSFTSFNVIAFPSDGSCLDAPGSGLRCSAEDVPAGVSQTFLFAVKSKSTTDAAIMMNILTTWTGISKLGGVPKFSTLSTMSTVAAE